jgi:predicted PurR-regulated permease PerM
MPEESDQDEDDFSTRRALIFRRAQESDVPLKTILVTVFTVVAVYLAGMLLFRLRDVLLLMLVGGFVALLLNPLVELLQRWKLPRRGFAVLVVTFAAVVAFAGLAFAFGYPLVNSTTHLVQALPSYIHKAEHGQGWIGHLLRRYHIENWLHKNSSKLVTFAKGLSKPALALGRGAATVMLLLVALFAFVVLLLLEGPKIRKASLRLISPKRSAWITRVGSEVSQAALGYMLGNLTTSLIAGFVVFITLWCLSVPFAFLWALWVALVDFLPQIGGALAGIPTVLFALVHSLTRTVKINPLTVFVAMLVAAVLGAWVDGIFGGFVGVMLAVPGAATIHVLFREIWNSTRPPSGHVASPFPGDDDVAPVS